MNATQILACRLATQQLLHTTFQQPHEVVAWMCGMQAQDYTQAKWAIGVRLPPCTEADVEKSVAEKRIIRTWLFRGTLHLAAARDIRWLLDLLAPRLIRSSAFRYRELELDTPTLLRSNDIIGRFLEGGKQATRAELATELTQKGISTEGQRLSFLLQRASLDQLVCQCGGRGKDMIYTLLEWPSEQPFYREEALAELATRYFKGHAPATFEDFVWWTGLSVTDARLGFESVRHTLDSLTLNDVVYWTPAGCTDFLTDMPAHTYLLPGFDEYVLGYTGRSLFLESQHARQAASTNGIFYPVLVKNGRIVGTWKRAIKKNTVQIEPRLFTRTSYPENVDTAIQQYARFLGKEPMVHEKG